MAQIVVNIDTDKQELAVTIGGKKVPNVTDISVWKEADSKGNVITFSASIYTREETQDGLVKRVSFHSVGSAKAEEAIATGNSFTNDEFPGFVGIEDKSKVQKDIAKFLSWKR